jgi:predicted AlkP superfamily pyrophosphatase or phosphodiesterase
MLFIISPYLIDLQMISGHKSSLSPEEELPRDHFKKFIVITWDGTRTRWLDEFSISGELSTIQTLREEGGEAYLRLGDTMSSTDPCLATIETGFGPKDHKITSNQFYSNIPGKSIPNGLQTSERFKYFFGDEFKTGHLNSWMHHDINDSKFTFPDGHISQQERFDSIFLNAQPGIDVDHWFGSENISWNPGDEESHHASFDEYWYGSWIHENITNGLLDPYDPTTYTSYGYIERFSAEYDQNIEYWNTLLLNAQFLADEATRFIESYSSENFYLRIHMTEPDYIGHRYGESSDRHSFNQISPEYLRGLEECDSAVEKIRQNLLLNDIYNDTLLLVGSDHGFLGTSHSEDPVLWVSNQEIWGYFKDQQSTPVYGYQHDIQPTLLALAGAQWSALNYPLAIPLYDLYGNNSRPTQTMPNLTTTTSGESEKSNIISLPFLPLFIAVFIIISMERRKLS